MLPDPFKPELNRLALAAFEVGPPESRALVQRLISRECEAAITVGKRPPGQVPCRLVSATPQKVSLWSARELDPSVWADDGMLVGLLDRYRIQFPARRLRRATPPAGAPAQALAGTLLECDFPVEFWRVNRRDAYRVKMPARQSIVLTVSVDTDTSLQLPVIDLSMGGLAFELPCEGPLSLTPGDRVPACHLQSESLQIPGVDLLVRSVERASPVSPVFRVGAAWIDPSATVRRDVQLMMYKAEAARRGR